MKAAKLRLIFISILLACHVFGSKYKLIQENLEIGFVDSTRLDILTAELIQVNGTKVINVKVELKEDPDENVNISATGFKNINNQYRLKLFHYETTAKKGLEMELFDMQVLFLKYTHPPLVWSLQTNVVYHMVGWTPDTSLWLPNFPEGKWKFQLNYMLPNNSLLLAANWFFKIQY